MNFNYQNFRIKYTFNQKVFITPKIIVNEIIEIRLENSINICFF